jgi:hypothetical protein
MRLAELITRARSNEDLTPNDHESYTNYLGLDHSDTDYLWIVQEALSAPLPEDWSEHVDAKGRVYFYNAAIDKSSWAHPLEGEFRKLIKLVKSVHARNSNATDLIASLRDDVKQLDRSLNSKLRLYQEHIDSETGNKFFYNLETGRSFWNDPRVCLLHLLRVKGRVLEILSSHLPSLAPSRAARPARQKTRDLTLPVVAQAPEQNVAGASPERESPKFGGPSLAEGGLFQGSAPRKKAAGVRLAPLNVGNK